jgi:ubiquitin-protein ligase
METWWGTRGNVSERLKVEVLTMQTAFGDTFKLTVPLVGELYWSGTIELNLTKLAHRAHTLKIIYPNNYPVSAPYVYIVEPRIWSPQYQLNDGKLSLFNPVDGHKYGWYPATGTATTIVGWAIHWLYAYHTWQFTGNWPEIFEGIE